MHIAVRTWRYALQSYNLLYRAPTDENKIYSDVRAPTSSNFHLVCARRARLLNSMASYALFHPIFIFYFLVSFTFTVSFRCCQYRVCFCFSLLPSPFCFSLLCSVFNCCYYYYSCILPACDAKRNNKVENNNNNNHRTKCTLRTGDLLMQHIYGWR